MTQPQKFWNFWQSHVYQVAAKFSRVVARYGWDTDDCTQHALMELWFLAAKPRLWGMAEGELGRYLTVVIKRSIWRKAYKPRTAVRDKRLLDLLEARSTDAVRDLMFELIDDAPIDIANYLAYRLFDTKDAVRGWSERKVTKVRKEAGEWLLSQLEGRVKS